MNDETLHEPSRQHRGRSGRALRIGAFAIFLVAAGVIGATLVAHTWAGSGFAHHGPGHWGKVQSAEQAAERAQDMAAWLAGSVDADATQSAELDRILGSLGADLFPLRKRHKLHRRELITELSQPEVDRAAVEQLRQQTVALADQATTELTRAFYQVSEVLDTGQRQKLTAMLAHSRHRSHH